MYHHLLLALLQYPVISVAVSTLAHLQAIHQIPASAILLKCSSDNSMTLFSGFLSHLAT